MAINPPSDIVLGAVLAADPSKYRAAAGRLRQAGGDAGAEFAASAPALNALAGQSAATLPEKPPANIQGQPASSARAAPSGQTGKPPDAFAQLEAFVLQSFIQTMLPKDSQNFFGKGTAGEVWKSMLAEKLGMQIASSHQLGLAKQLAAGRSGAAAVGHAPAAALGGAPRMPASLTGILPYMQSTSAVVTDDALADENTLIAERS